MHFLVWIPFYFLVVCRICSRSVALRIRLLSAVSSSVRSVDCGCRRMLSGARPLETAIAQWTMQSPITAVIGIVAIRIIVLMMLMCAAVSIKISRRLCCRIVSSVGSSRVASPPARCIWAKSASNISAHWPVKWIRTNRKRWRCRDILQASI